jgi:hypothetical protein
MPPRMVMPLFSQQMSSGYGARYMPMGLLLIVRGLIGMHGVQNAWSSLWGAVALWMKKYLLD